MNKNRFIGRFLLTWMFLSLFILCPYKTVKAEELGKNDITTNTVNICSDEVKVFALGMNKVYEYTGNDIVPVIRLIYQGKFLNPMFDYTVEYKNNVSPGKASIVLKGVGNYSGEIQKEFVISKRQISNVTLKTGFEKGKLYAKAYNGSCDLEYGIDYSYFAVSDAEGNIIITFNGLGDNYTGIHTETIPAKDNPNAKINTVKIKNIKNKKGKKIVLKWKKVSKANGYQIRYAKNINKLKKAKLITVSNKKRTYMIKKLKKKKIYYVQIRAYKTVDGMTYFSDWSQAKSIRISK